MLESRVPFAVSGGQPGPAKDKPSVRKGRVQINKTDSELVGGR